MQLTGLKFTENEFRQMPISRFSNYLKYCREYNEAQNNINK